MFSFIKLFLCDISDLEYTNIDYNSVNWLFFIYNIQSTIIKKKIDTLFLLIIIILF